MTTRAGAECRAADSVPGAVVFDAVGTVSFGGDGDASALDPPPGHAKLVAASSKHGVVCYADARGVYAIETDVLCDVASALKEKVPAEQVVPRDARGFTPMRRVSHVSFSADETVLAACVGGVVHLFETRAILESARARGEARAFRAQTLGDDDDDDDAARVVRDLQWLPERTSRAGYLALLVHDGDDDERAGGSLIVGSAATEDQDAEQTAIAENVVAFAVAPGDDDDDAAIVAWSERGAGVVLAKLTDQGYSAEMRRVSIGPIDDGDGDGAVEVAIDGLAFGPRPGLTLLATAT